LILLPSESPPFLFPHSSSSRLKERHHLTPFLGPEDSYRTPALPRRCSSLSKPSSPPFETPAMASNLPQFEHCKLRSGPTFSPASLPSPPEKAFPPPQCCPGSFARHPFPPPFSSTGRSTGATARPFSPCLPKPPTTCFPELFWSTCPPGRIVFFEIPIKQHPFFPFDPWFSRQCFLSSPCFPCYNRHKFSQYQLC